MVLDAIEASDIAESIAGLTKAKNDADAEVARMK